MTVFDFIEQHPEIVPPSVAFTDGTLEPAFIEFEMERRLIPAGYWPTCGDRVAALGRWIVDCGHDNYSTEIHPPLIVAKATANGDATGVQIFGRAFLASQLFAGKSLLQHLLAELGDREERAVAAMAFPPAAPLIDGMDARPALLQKPFSGLQTFAFTVRPPKPREHEADRLLLSYHFTVRQGVSVAVINGRHKDEVDVLIVMVDDSYNSAQELLTVEEKIVTFDDVSRGLPSDADRAKLGALLASAVAAAPLTLPTVLAKGIRTTRYTVPPAQSGFDNTNVHRSLHVAEGVSAVPNQFAVDDGQPYPLYGWMTLEWERHADQPAKPGTPDPAVQRR
jgi:hypothetical protein